MASASVIYARRFLGLHPEWPDEIAQMTNLTIDNLGPALNLMKKYCRLIKKNMLSFDLVLIEIMQ